MAQARTRNPADDPTWVSIPPFDRSYEVVDFRPVLAGNLGALGWVDTGAHPPDPQRPYGAVVSDFGAPRGTLLGFFRTRDAAADFNTKHAENAPFERPPGVAPFVPGTAAADTWTGPLWMHDVLRDVVREKGYPILPRAPNMNPEWLFRNLRGVLDATWKDPDKRALALVRAWLDAQGYYQPPRGTPDVTAFADGVEGWIPFVPVRYLRDPTHPMQEGLGLVWIMLLSNGRVRGFRWIDRAADKAHTEGRAVWVMRPVVQEVLNGSVRALGDLLAHETKERRIVEEYAHTREYQRRLVANLSDENLHALLQRPATDTNRALVALAHEEAGRRRMQASPDYLRNLGAVWGVGGADRLLASATRREPPPPPPPAIVKMAEAHDPRTGSWGLAVDAAGGATLYHFAGDGWTPRAAGRWEDATGPAWGAPLDPEATRVLPALLAQLGVAPVTTEEAIYDWVVRMLPDAERALGVRAQRPALGMGTYGNVFALAGDPSRVLKITSDRREVAAWQLVAAARVAGWPLPGFARLDQGPVPVGSLGKLDRGGDEVLVHAYVREAVAPLPDDVLNAFPRYRLGKADGQNLHPDDAPLESPLAAASENARRWAETSAPAERTKILARYRYWLGVLLTDTRQTPLLPGTWKPFEAVCASLLHFVDMGHAIPLDVEHLGNVGQTADGRYVAYDFGVPFPRPLALRSAAERKGKRSVEPHVAQALQQTLRTFGAA